MNREIITGLIYNVSLLLILSIICNTFFVYYEKNDKQKHIFAGFVIGIIGILLMLTPVKLIPGIFFDTRSILMSVTAMFFGYMPTMVAAAVVCAGRILIGGDGALMGVLVIIITSAIGLLWFRFRLRYAMVKKHPVFIEFYLVGIAAHIAMLLCMFTLPQNMRSDILKQMWVPVLLVYPIGSLILSTVLYDGIMSNQTKLALIDSEKKHNMLNREIHNKQTLLKTLIDSVPDLIFYKDVNSVYIGCNSAFEKFAGMEESGLIGRTDFDLFGNEMAELFRAMDQEMIKQAKPRKNDEVVEYPDGRKVYLETLKTPHFDDQGNMLGLIGISRDITERKKKEQEILFLTYHDSLTGLYNRTFFDQETKRLDTQHLFPLSIITGDINGLKLINDAFGHSEGDKLLAEVAQILLSCSRPGDVVARIGGDEFSILLPKTSSQTVSVIVEEIKNTCKQYVNRSNKETFYISISLGYATKENANESFNDIKKSAEELMYRRKLLEKKSLHSSIISSIKTSLYEKSHETENHTERLADLTKKLGSALGLGEKDIVELELLSMLHDIGKIGVDDGILAKNDDLNENEWREMKKHPEIGYRIAMAAPELQHIAEYILSHHERWDGKGYPQGLSGENIPLLSRILAIIDSYDAMTYDRVYRKAISYEQAKAEIMKNAGTQFDPEVAGIFIEKVLNIPNSYTTHQSQLIGSLSCTRPVLQVLLR